MNARPGRLPDWVIGHTDEEFAPHVANFDPPTPPWHACASGQYSYVLGLNFLDDEDLLVCVRDDGVALVQTYHRDDKTPSGNAIRFESVEEARRHVETMLMKFTGMDWAMFPEENRESGTLFETGVTSGARP